jgi:ABC-type transport system involved in cytochrome c biogenesis permease subunit
MKTPASRTLAAALWKTLLPWAFAVIAILWIAANSRMPKPAPGEPDLISFGKLPVLADGRNKPLDTVARTSLLIIHGKQSLPLEDGRRLDARHWLADVLFNGQVADEYPAFVIHNPEVLGLFGWEQTDRKDFRFSELIPFLEKIDVQGQQADAVESARRTPFQTGIRNLRHALILYQRLKISMRPEATQSFSGEIAAFEQAIPGGLDAMNKREKGLPYDQENFMDFIRLASRFKTMAEMANLLPVPPAPTVANPRTEWISVGASLLEAISSGKVPDVTADYARLGDAYQSGEAEAFNRELQVVSARLSTLQPQAVHHAAYEFLFNRLEPFYQAMGLYVLAFLVVCGFWLTGNRSLANAAFGILLLALAVHTFGLVSRMYLQGRPPVTNLYSSAIFIGWVTVIVSLLLERLFRDGIGSICAATIGFITLIIAHHLAGSGDTLEMLQAVLDTNIWLATHVVTITIGYSAMFLAGMLAILYVVRGVFTRSLTKSAAQSLTRMTYGVVCFATLFSVVGTVLGGIWADQSWGRFWGWDPKENGALLIVLWCAIILHARWGGFIRERGLMVMALFGNIITSFSWFGVNMLGVGLHSYGFMNKAVPWLAAFILSQLVLMVLAYLPRDRWRSSKPAAK